MKLTVNIWERVMLGVVLGQLQGVNLATLRKAGKALDVIELSPTEAEEVGLSNLPNGGIAWTDGNKEYDLEIKDPEAAHVLKLAFSQFTGWQGQDTRRALVLAEKLGIEEEK